MVHVKWVRLAAARRAGAVAVPVQEALERNACRSQGGRVFAANGSEITMATEAEYDKKVRRVTFKSN